MKNARRIISLMLVLILCLTFATAASAASNSKSAGIYGRVNGSSSQNKTNLVTGTSITQNPDNARLKVKIILTNTSSTVATPSKRSAAGATSLPYTYVIQYMYENEPTLATCEHIVSDGINDAEYSCYTSTSLDTSYFN